MNTTNKKRSLPTWTVLTIGAIMAAASGTKGNASVPNHETESAVRALGASAATEIKFDSGKSALSETERNEIQRALNEARAKGAIKEVKVISWADREYPIEGEKASKEAIALAQDRAEHLQNFLKKSGKVNSVRAYNMAKRPNAVEDLFKTSQATVKEKLEKEGAAPTEGKTGLLGLKGKASSALVLIYQD